MHFGADFMLGVWRDDLDVRYYVFYRIVREIAKESIQSVGESRLVAQRPSRRSEALDFEPSDQLQS